MIPSWGFELELLRGTILLSWGLELELLLKILPSRLLILVSEVELQPS